MSILGVGPLLAVTGGLSFVLILVFQGFWGVEASVSAAFQPILFGAGALIGVIGFYFWLASALLIGRKFAEHQLITAGVYRYSRNPMYAAFIVFLIPASALLLNDLLILLVSLVMFSVFKISIRKEEAYLRSEFGPEYQHYTERVAQLIPFIKL
jgi:protein-S-isoprenylcysteine O-methyltransferase Ste14